MEAQGSRAIINYQLLRQPSKVIISFGYWKFLVPVIGVIGGSKGGTLSMKANGEKAIKQSDGDHGGTLSGKAW
jgi:hypothetical protein